MVTSLAKRPNISGRLFSYRQCEGCIMPRCVCNISNRAYWPTTQKVVRTGLLDLVWVEKTGVCSSRPLPGFPRLWLRSLTMKLSKKYIHMQTYNSASAKNNFFSEKSKQVFWISDWSNVIYNTRSIELVQKLYTV